jgi:hypothetical protein
MADTKISALTAATSIGTTDTWTVVQGGTNKKFAHSVLLANAQTWTNQTLTAPVISTISNTGTLTLPTSTDTLVGRATTDTLTNKTLTSPVINTPTGIVKGDVGLGNVDNTSNATERAASATLTNKTMAFASNTFTGFPAEICIACSDETTAITTGTAKATFRMPFAMTLTAVRASVTTAPTGSTILIDINESGTTVISTKLMIDASEKTSQTAATPYVISDSALADDAEITIDFDQVGSTVAGAGVKVWLIGTR